MRKGQASVFVIVAILIVAAIVAFFVFRGQIGSDSVPTEVAPVYGYYTACIEREVTSAIQIAGAQGGRIDTGEYIPGTEYAPFSSHLNFLGTPVPYWFYISGNGVISENVPTRSEIEEDMAQFIGDGLEFCEFESFYIQGYDIELGDSEVEVSIDDSSVRVEVSSPLEVRLGDVSGSKISHVVEVDSSFGSLHEEALDIYERQRDEALLEDYAVDVLYLYAPVDGVSIQCAPEIWSTQSVISEVKQGLQENLARIKFSGDYYQVDDEDDNYFVIDLPVERQVNVMYSQNWPTKFEISGEGVDDEVIVAEPIGTQEGLGVMGFCYIPYHFVYDVSFPAMIQLIEGDSLFQFPVVVIIDNNVQREANLEGLSNFEEESYDVCQFREQEIEVNVYDVNLRPVDARLSFECFDQKCNLGESANGVYRGLAPKCVNGILQARSEGYADTQRVVSTNRDSNFNVVLQREHEVDVRLEIDGREFSEGTAVIAFTSEEGESYSVALPEFNTLQLSEGQYDVRVYVYGDSDVVIPASSKRECVEVPSEGLLGFFGSTEEECFDVDLPETRLEFALTGGGSTPTYILEDQLELGGMTVSVRGLPEPTTLEQLQENFEIFETYGVNFEYYRN